MEKTDFQESHEIAFKRISRDLAIWGKRNGEAELGKLSSQLSAWGSANIWMPDGEPVNHVEAILTVLMIRFVRNSDFDFCKFWSGTVLKTKTSKEFITTLIG